MRYSLLLVLVASLAFAGQNAPKVNPEQKKAQSVLDGVHAKLAKANSIKATVEVRMLDRVDKYELTFLRNNFAKIVSKDAGIYQDGKTYYDYNPLDKEYWTKPAPAKGLPEGTAFSLGGLTGLESIGFSNEQKMVAARVTAAKWEGESTKAVELKGDSNPDLKATLFVGVKSGLPVGWEFTIKDFKASGRIRNITLNAALKPTDFAWSPPPGATKVGT